MYYTFHNISYLLFSHYLLKVLHNLPNVNTIFFGGLLYMVAKDFLNIDYYTIFVDNYSNRALDDYSKYTLVNYSNRALDIHNNRTVASHSIHRYNTVKVDGRTKHKIIRIS